MSGAPQVTFAAWSLPRSMAQPGAGGGSFDAGRVHVEVAALDEVRLLDVASSLRGGADTLRDLPASRVIRALGRVGERFLDDADPLRGEALALLPETSGLSAEMSRATLDGMAWDWTQDRLRALVDAELGTDADALERFTDRGGRSVRALGPGLCTQVVSGSVPGVGTTALVRSLLVRAPTLLKPGRGDLVLPVLFARALADEDEALAAGCAVVYWPGGVPALDEAALAEADVVVAYGGDDAVQALRARTPATARFIGYHHRVSVGVVGRDALTEGRAGETAAEAARAVAFFDQRGCVSPAVVFAERGGEVAPEGFAEALAGQLEALEEPLPGGALGPAEASAVHQARGTAELRAAAGEGVTIRHGGRAWWTVVYDPEGGSVPRCVGRFVTVEPVDDALDVGEHLRRLRGHVQTVAVAGLAGRSRELAERYARAGATRITPFGEAAFPPPWWHHDGRGPLRALLRWTDLE